MIRCLNIVAKILILCLTFDHADILYASINSVRASAIAVTN